MRSKPSIPIELRLVFWVWVTFCLWSSRRRTRLITKSRKLARKVKKGKGFDLEDLRDQFAQMENMGGLGNLIDKLPGVGAGVSQAMQNPAHAKQMKRMIAIIDS
eukprot:UN04246